LFDISDGVAMNNIRLCVEAKGKGLSFSIYSNNTEYELLTSNVISDSVWQNVTAEVDGNGTMILNVNGKSVGQFKGVAPRLLVRRTASVGRQSAPSNGGYALFQGYIDSFSYSSTNIKGDTVQPPATITEKGVPKVILSDQ